MTSLHDELDQLTSAQPLQPVDRLQAVTGKARRMRRNRALASALALVVIGGGVASAVQVSKPHPVQYAATPVTTWDDRSTDAGKAVRIGAFSAWYGVEDGADVDLHWLYADVVDLPDHTSQAVVDFIATKEYVTYLVRAHADAANLDAHGTPSDPSNGWVIDPFDLATVATPPSHLDHVLSYPHGTELVSVQSPTARTLTVTQRPLPFAAAAGMDLSRTRVVLRSEGGVFTSDLGAVTGPLTVTPPKGPGYAPAADIDLQLATPAELTAYRGQFSANGSSNTADGEDGSWPGGGESVLDRTTATLVVTARCYGGGTLTAKVMKDAGPLNDEHPIKASSAPCDGQVHELVTDAHVVNTAYTVGFSGDRLQAFSYVVSTT